MLAFPMKFDAPYCLTHQDGKTHYASGDIRRQRLLAEVPRRGRWPVFSMVPFSQLRERGFDVHDRGEEILSLVPGGTGARPPQRLGAHHDRRTTHRQP
jgi:hypothetical protein